MTGLTEQPGPGERLAMIYMRLLKAKLLPTVKTGLWGVFVERIEWETRSENSICRTRLRVITDGGHIYMEVFLKEQ